MCSAHLEEKGRGRENVYIFWVGVEGGAVGEGGEFFGWWGRGPKKKKMGGDRREKGWGG